MFAQDVLVEELQAVAVDLDGAPGMAFDQGVKISFEIFQCQSIRAAVKEGRDAANGTGVDINGGCGLALAVQCVNMLLVQ